MTRTYETPGIFTLAGLRLSLGFDGEFGDNACSSGGGSDNACTWGSNGGNGCNMGERWDNGCVGGGRQEID